MRRLVPVLSLCALMAGCGTSPPSHFYTLTPATAASTTGASAASGDKSPAASSNFSVAVGPISIPAVVDRPEIVVSTGTNEVHLDEFNRWASPLQDNLARVIAENLVVMLSTPRVSVFPQTLSADAEYRVAIEVQRFDSAPGKSATLDVVWIVRPAKDGKAQTGRTNVVEKVPDNNNSFDALAAAHSRAVARLSQDIADAVLALDRAAR